MIFFFSVEYLTQETGYKTYDRGGGGFVRGFIRNRYVFELFANLRCLKCNLKLKYLVSKNLMYAIKRIQFRKTLSKNAEKF